MRFNVSAQNCEKHEQFGLTCAQAMPILKMLISLTEMHDQLFKSAGFDFQTVCKETLIISIDHLNMSEFLYLTFLIKEFIDKTNNGLKAQAVHN